MMNKKICIYGRSATKVESIKDWLKPYTDEMEGVSGWAMPDDKDIYFDNGVSGNKEHREALDIVLERVAEGIYDLVVIPEAYNLARDYDLLYKLTARIVELGAEIFIMSNKGDSKAILMPMGLAMAFGCEAENLHRISRIQKKQISLGYSAE